MDGNHLLQCTELDEYPTDDVVSRYWEKLLEPVIRDGQHSNNRLSECLLTSHFKATGRILATDLLNFKPWLSDEQDPIDTDWLALHSPECQMSKPTGGH
ncbi:hypothetical protein TNCV_4169651 [Trichonephila clavipes]|nr:hypothetical protein TNCV_4169651 [Trichonephila clavipes]